jgi:hypothetical protein
VRYNAGDEVTSGFLYRRIPPRNSHFKDGRLTSQVFSPNRRRNEHKLSALLAELTTPEDALAGREEYGLAQIAVETVRAAGFTMRLEPEGGEPAHVSIYGNFSDESCRLLARKAEVIRVPRIGKTGTP